VTTFDLKAGPGTTHWGYFDAAQPAAMTVPSGAKVRITSVSGTREVLPPAGFHVPPELHAIHAAQVGIPFGPHILTGPCMWKALMPGDVLEVRILDVGLHQDWGFNFNRPLAGTLPDDFPSYHLMHIALDAARMIGTMPWGLELPLAPFFGVMGVAPPAPGAVAPRSFRGLWRQYRQQGTGRGQHALSAGVCRRSRLLMR
jgi:acetamidase/formamidase